MILFYIDESGTGLRDRETPYFVLSSIAIAAQDSRYVDSEISSLKRRLVSWAKPEDWEIKGRDLRRGDKFFKGQNWQQRARAFREIAETLSELRCEIHSVQVDKRLLPEYISTDSDLYRIALWRLLEELNNFLERTQELGMLMLDMRSDMHSSVQDRRTVDAFRDWIASVGGRTRIIELPWFGFSAFYAGIQLADFVSYLVDFVSNQDESTQRASELEDAFALIRAKVARVRIP